MPRWIFPVFAAILGIATGLLYGWIINPVKFVDTTPASLRADYRADYVLMVAESFHGNQDAALASKRLAIFGTESPAEITEDAVKTGETAGFSQDDLTLIQELTRGLQAFQPIPTAAEYNTMRRIPWEVVLSLIGGLVAGLLYAWIISPIRYVDTAPSTLRADFKDAFRAAIAASYSESHNLDRASARLALLGDANPVEALSAQAQRMLASGDPFEVVQSVAGLASDLRTGVSSISSLSTATANPTVPSPVPATPQPSVVATAADTAIPTDSQSVPTQAAVDTPTARPTRTAVPTASAPFQLISNDQVCNNNLTEGLMQISVLDRHHHQMPGVEIDISWNGGEEQFFTGLKPEIADGYADFVMQAGVTYAVRVAHSSSPASGLSAPSCPESGGQTFVGGLKLLFQQP